MEIKTKTKNGLVPINLTLLSQLLRVKQTNKCVYKLLLQYEDIKEKTIRKEME